VNRTISFWPQKLINVTDLERLVKEVVTEFGSTYNARIAEYVVMM
jgi:hypothetical protein